LQKCKGKIFLEGKLCRVARGEIKTQKTMLYQNVIVILSYLCTSSLLHLESIAMIIPAIYRYVD
jgi:hypothetical protein